MNRRVIGLDWRGGRTASRRVAVLGRLGKASKGTNAETWLKHEADDMLLAMPGSFRIRQPHECGITACRYACFRTMCTGGSRERRLRPCPSHMCRCLSDPATLPPASTMLSFCG
jgi:hypothetical protein